MIALLLLHFAVTWALVGLILTIQFVHYPLFMDVGKDQFVSYHKLHMVFISWLVIPLMIIEAGTAVCLISLGEQSVVFLISMAALTLIWLSTWIFQVPLHHKLTQGYDSRVIRLLVRSNLLRAIGWTVRGVCVAVLIHSYAA